MVLDRLCLLLHRLELSSHQLLVFIQESNLGNREEMVCMRVMSEEKVRPRYSALEKRDGMPHGTQTRHTHPTHPWMDMLRSLIN